jgi:hypothetical protein
MKSYCEGLVMSEEWKNSFKQEQKERLFYFLNYTGIEQLKITSCNTLGCYEDLINDEYLIDKNNSDSLILTGFIVNSIESFDAIDLYNDNTIDKKVSKTLITAFYLATNAIKTSSLLLKTREIIEQNNLSEGYVPYDSFNNESQILFNNILFLDKIERESCAPYNLLNIAELWRINLENKVKDTKYPPLKLMRSIDILALEKCNPILNQFVGELDVVCISEESSIRDKTKAIDLEMSAAANWSSCVSEEISKIEEIIEKEYEN